MNKQRVYVWDPLVRIFHWSLVLFFTIAYVTEDEQMELHELSGYIVLGLVGFRIIWGLVGPKYARFTNFIYGPATVIKYVTSLFSSPKHYVGHNPAGGTMVIVLLVMITLTSWTGIKAEEVEGNEHASINITLIGNAYADEDEEKNGEKDGDEFWEELHEAAANLTVFFVFLHIVGVFASSAIHNENLVKAMVTGYKDKKD